MTDPYLSSLEFLYGRLNYERQVMPRAAGELRIGRMRRLLRAAGDPQDALRIIHVAGTKGKGSTSAMIAAALSASGVSTGLFCSPHLHQLEERFNVDGEPATADELVALTDALRPVVEASEQSGFRGPTFFEITTAMGLLHFARRGVGAVALEVGLGGRLDSTNAVRAAVSVVTNISFDHTRQLGTTLAAIAREKAGIFKRAGSAVSGEFGGEARDVIRQTAADRRCGLREIGVDFSSEFVPPDRPITRPTAGQVAVRTWARDWGTLDLPLLGRHQAHNAAVALAALDAFAETGYGPEPVREAVIRGFSTLRWPARVEVIGEAPWFVIDGAHNVASAEALAATLAACFPACPRTLVFGTTRDKDLRGQLQALLPTATEVVTTRYVDNPRAVPPDEVAAAVHELTGREPLVTWEPGEALAAARRITPRDGLVCVTGSLFLAAESRAILLGKATAPVLGRAVL